MTTQLMVDYPDTLPDMLQESREDFEREAKMAMALKLFEMKRISSGQAAEFAGMNRTAFLLSLHRYGIPMIDISDNELTSDAENA